MDIAHIASLFINFTYLTIATFILQYMRSLN